MAPKEIRGQLGSGVQWLFALGVMISYWVRDLRMIYVGLMLIL
jgi:hypothetical protein